MIAPSLLSIIRTLIGEENFFDSPEHKLVYSYDATPLFHNIPDAIIRPQNAEQISTIIRMANEEGFAIVPRGSGTGLSGGSIPTENSIVLLTNHWNKILELDEKNLTAWVEPGVITAQLQAEVEKKGLFYPPDPGSAAISTLGGNVAENAGGLRGLKYGVTKNYVLGMEVVLPHGDIVLLGGKSVKDVAGYNLKDFLIGSEGTLGIFTKLLFRLLPKPQTSRTMLVFFNKLSDAAETVSDIIASRISPSVLEFLDNTTIRCVENYAHLNLPTSIEALLLMEVDGHIITTKEDIENISILCKKHHALGIQIAANDDEAQRLRRARKVAFSALARIQPTTILEDVTVPRSEIIAILETIRRVSNTYQLQFGNFGHAGDGNMHPTCLTDERNSAEITKVEKAFDEIFSKAVQLGGTITGEHGTGLAKRHFFEKHIPSPALEFMRKIKGSIDPNGIFNPGKVLTSKPRCEGPMPLHKKQIQNILDSDIYA